MADMTFRAPRMTQRESAAWLGIIGVSGLLPAALDTQLQRDAQMTHFEFMVLSNLQLGPGEGMRMTALAEATYATLPRLSHVCARLDRRGDLTRRPCDQDRRATVVTLTPEGRRRLIHAMPGHIATARRLVIDALTAGQLDALAEISAVLLDRLGAPGGLDPVPARATTSEPARGRARTGSRAGEDDVVPPG